MLVAVPVAFGLGQRLQYVEGQVAAGGSFVLSDDVPASFGDWKVDSSISPLRAAGDVQAELRHIYSQLLSRTFVNSQGKHVMLSIAYTGQIDQQMDIHRPENCYPAQGFEVHDIRWDSVASPYGPIAVKRMVGRIGSRVEPITYWVTVGEHAVSTGFRRKVARLVNRLTGQVTDGMLIRVSSIERDADEAYRTQEQFIAAMLQAVPAKDRKRFTGTL